MGKCQSRDKIIKRREFQKSNTINAEIIIKKSLNNTPFDFLSYISKQRENVFKIMKEDKIIGSGFLCIIPYPDKLNLLPVLFTCNRVLNNEDIKSGKEINLIFKNNKNKILKIDESRKIYTSDKKENDVTIIEIKKEDGFKINNMLEIDYDIYEEDKLIKLYKKQSIYIILSSNNLISFYSINIIKSIDHKKIKIKHLCETEEDSSGCPLLNFKNFKVMGIHNKKYKKKNYNLGTIIREPIESFYDLTKEDKQKNEIYLTLEVLEDDINKDIYFLDNFNNEDKEGKNSSEYLKELNEYNTKIFINDIEYKYKKYFKPEKEGIYSIKIELNINIKDCSYMFYKCLNIKTIDLSSFNSKNVINMSGMFSLCHNLISINLSSFDTKNVVDMSQIFQGCSNLTDIDLSSFNTKNVTNMNGMFSCCSKITNIDLSSFDTQNVIDMGEMFFWCPNLTNIDLSSFKTKKDDIYMEKMFICCNNLKCVKVNNNFFQKIKEQNDLNKINLDFINE